MRHVALESAQNGTPKLRIVQKYIVQKLQNRIKFIIKHVH